MRRSIPLITAMALFVAVSCDQQPVEPTQDEAAGGPLFAKGGNGAGIWTDNFPFTIDACGYDVLDCDITEKGAFHFHDDAAGGSHYKFSASWHGTCTGRATGETWRWNDTENAQSQWQAVGQDEYFYRNWTSTLVGTGQIPNFRSFIRGHYAIDANGEMKSDQYREYECIEAIYE